MNRTHTTPKAPIFGRISRMLAASAAIAAVAGTWAGVASASSAPARHAAAGQTISLYCHGGSSAFLNLARKAGPAAGDESIMSQPCYSNAHRTQLMGQADVISTFVSTSAATGHAVAALNAGDILIAGVESESGPFTFAVTGGTGSYEGARGQAVITPQSGKGNPAMVTISLLP